MSIAAAPFLNSQVLNSHGWATGRFSAADWASALHLDEPETYRKGETLFRQGALCPDVYLIVAGYVNLIATDPQTGLDRTLMWRGPSQFLGDAPIVLGCRSLVSARTATDCTVYRIRSTQFLRMLGAPGQNSVLWHLLQANSRQLMDLTRMTALTDSAQALLRLEHVLCRLLVEQHGQNVNHAVRLAEYSPTNRELAGYIGVNPTYIPALFKLLQAEGIASRVRGAILISRPGRLEAACEAFRPPPSPPVDWARWLGLGAARRFHPGYPLLQENEPPEDIFLIQRGFVRLSTEQTGDLHGDGGEHAVSWSHSGELLGHHSAILESAQPLRAETGTQCHLHCVSARQFLNLVCPEGSTPMLELMKAQSRDYLEITRNLVVARTQALKSRIAYVLWRLAEQQFGRPALHGVRLTAYSPSNATLAGYLGTEERYVSSLMQDLKSRKILWRGAGRVITINDCGALMQAGNCGNPPSRTRMLARFQHA